MKTLIYISHPAQYLFFKNFIKIQIENNKNLIIIIKEKDILEQLLICDAVKYIKINNKKSKSSIINLFIELITRIIKIGSIIIKEKPNILIGTDASIAILSWLLRVYCITTLEDDYNVIPRLAKSTYPFTSTILTPNICDVSKKWERKKIGYNGYMKLAYLHPNYFIPNKQNINEFIKDKYVIIRLSKLAAHHDNNVQGIDNYFLNKIIIKIQNYGYKCYISSERNLPDEFSQYILKTPPNEMHNLLFFSSLLICDSQSMTVESSILGVPSIRISDFVGKISVLEELENIYKLTIGIKPNEKDKIIEYLNKFLEDDNLKSIYSKRREYMLSNKIDVTSFLVWFINNYPKSKFTMKENPEYQNKFI